MTHAMTRYTPDLTETAMKTTDEIYKEEEEAAAGAMMVVT
jgi:hypothetical protein